MKKSLLGALTALPFLFIACTPTTGNEQTIPKTNSVTQDTTTIDGKNLSDTAWTYIDYSLSDYAGKTVSIDFSADMKVTNTGSKGARLMWQLNLSDYPVLAEYTFEPGTSNWITVTSTDKEKKYDLGDSTVLYLSMYQTTKEDLKIELKNIKYTITSTEVVNQNNLNWLSDEVPSIKDTYKDIFDSFGIACEYSSWSGVKELSVQSVCNGLKKHADSITMGNEFKPDSFLSNIGTYAQSTPTLVDFTASNGKTIKVPNTLTYTTVDNCLSACAKNGLKMRGHVLVWHSQTPENFFAENYKAKTSGELITNLVDKETMTARQEWYIKSVMEHVADWESKNNNGEHIIWAWDVVNEAMADDAKNNDTNYIRGSTDKTKDKKPSDGGSRWYQVYGSDEFIINAFRFANAYAPSDVKLCYNDYNEYMDYNGGWKTTAILKTISRIKNGEAQTINGKSVSPRIDVMGMQSHVGVSWPGVSGFESALKRYLEVVDVHVTEFDVSATSTAESKSTYSDYFKMLKKYGKTYSGDHKVQNVTVWGINNKTSWIYKGNTKYPLLFDNYNTTPTFDAVINAAK